MQEEHWRTEKPTTMTMVTEYSLRDEGQQFLSRACGRKGNNTNIDGAVFKIYLCDYIKANRLQMTSNTVKIDHELQSIFATSVDGEVFFIHPAIGRTVSTREIAGMLTWLFTWKQPNELISQEKHEKCPICLQNPINRVTQCGHGFCRACLNMWFETAMGVACPMCRSHVKISKLSKV